MRTESKEIEEKRYDNTHYFVIFDIPCDIILFCIYVFEVAQSFVICLF